MGSGRLLIVCLASTALGAEPPGPRYDLAILGGTASGVAAAIVGARAGLRVVLVERTDRLGGMISNGVCKTDIGMREASSGLFEEFRALVRKQYRDIAECEAGFKYEPKVALQVIRSMVAAEPGIEVLLRTRFAGVLRGPAGGVEGFQVAPSQGAKRALRAKITIDATDEADLAVQAGAQYRIGREARSPEEPHAGVIYLERGGVNPRDKSISHPYRILPGSTGEADTRIQGFSFLMTLKDYGPGAKDRPHVLKSPPPGYNPGFFANTVPWEKSWAMFSGRLPNNKHEVNQYPNGAELPGENDAYVDGNDDVRDAIVKRHREHALGYLYWLQHVEDKSNLGLADDEYVDNGNFPVQMYVRQGRRVLGLEILDESHINPFLKGDGVRPPRFPDAIATGTFALDVHPVRPKRAASDVDSGEGELFLPEVTAPFQVPYRCLVPKGVERLLVSQAVSSTHIGYQGVRLEGVRVSMGMAAGIAASLAIRGGRPLAEVNVRELQDRLLDAASLLYVYRDLPAGSPWFKAVQKLSLAGAMDGFDDYTFRPGEPITRAQLAETAVRAFSLPISVTGLHFKDVPRRHPAVRYVETLYDRMFLSPFVHGEADTFGPDTPVTAAQLERLLALLTGRSARSAAATPVARGAAAVRILESLEGRP
jgi:hypothetical protein